MSSARAASLEHIFERRVGDEPAVPIGLVVDLDGREAGRKRAACHDVLGSDELLGRVEILHVAGDHLNRADAQPHRAGIEEIEIDKLEQRLLSGFVS